MTSLYLTICCSAESDGRPKIPRLNAAPSPYPPNIPAYPSDPSVFFIGTVMISSTTTTTAFPQTIYYPSHFLGTYRPIRSTYHPLTSGFRKIWVSVRVIRYSILWDLLFQIRNGYGGSRPLSSYSGFGGEGVVASVAVVIGRICGGGGSDRTCDC